MEHYKIENVDCVEGAKNIKDSSVDLFICDPPFGIEESKFGKHYKRNDVSVSKGYIEAPEEYEEWCTTWLSIAKTKLKPQGTIYLISGWSKLCEVLNAVKKVELHQINHCIWKYNFGVNTSKKYVSSHYHILMLSNSMKPKFNSHCRFGPQDTLPDGGKALYRDLEDVFVINKEYQQSNKGILKNQNKLPDALIEKLILYSSDPGDTVCDLFMGNFTTAYNALKLGRNTIGFEINEEIYTYHMNQIPNIIFGERLATLNVPCVVKPKNQGKKITDDERKLIYKDYDNLKDAKKTEKEIKTTLCEKYGRGQFSINNILETYKKQKKVEDTSV